ncbi:hypothetical protein MPC1_7090002 [Methylocella tundrae]|nr:hypothetical protein MPC1_7090002 [Methylocella tundrae]
MALVMLCYESVAGRVFGRSMKGRAKMLPPSAQTATRVDVKAAQRLRRSVYALAAGCQEIGF